MLLGGVLCQLSLDVLERGQDLVLDTLDETEIGIWSLTAVEVDVLGLDENSVLWDSVEVLHDNEVLSVEVRLVLVRAELLGSNDLIVDLRDDSNQEVEQDDQIDEGVEKPEAPDGSNDGVSTPSIDVLVVISPPGVARCLDISDGVSVGSHESDNKVRNIWIIISAKVDSKDPETESEEGH